MPLMISFRTLILLSFSCSCVAWYSPCLIAMYPLKGTKSSRPASPANTDGPISLYKKNMDSAIWNGPDLKCRSAIVFQYYVKLCFVNDWVYIFLSISQNDIFSYGFLLVTGQYVIIWKIYETGLKYYSYTIMYQNIKINSKSPSTLAASTAIKFTISPTVEDFLAEFDNFKACVMHNTDVHQTFEFTEAMWKKLNILANYLFIKFISGQFHNFSLVTYICMGLTYNSLSVFLHAFC